MHSLPRHAPRLEVRDSSDAEDCMLADDAALHTELASVHTLDASSPWLEPAYESPLRCSRSSAASWAAAWRQLVRDRTASRTVVSRASISPSRLWYARPAASSTTYSRSQHMSPNTGQPTRKRTNLKQVVVVVTGVAADAAARVRAGARRGSARHRRRGTQHSRTHPRHAQRLHELKPVAQNGDGAGVLVTGPAVIQLNTAIAA